MSNEAVLSLPPATRRGASRSLSDREAICHLLGLGKRACRWAMVRDISTRDVGLVTWRPVAPGTSVLIELLGPRRGDKLGRLGRVIRCEIQDNGSWLVGCTFAHRLGDDELARLLG